MVFGIGEYFEASDFKQIISSNQDISRLKNLLSRRDFSAIIENPNFFWLTFCKAFSQINIQDKVNFTVKSEGNTLAISGREHMIPDIQEFVEEIRKFFVKASAQKTNFTLLPISISDRCFLREKAPMIDLRDWLSRIHVYIQKAWFKDYIKTTMQSFCGSIGATCSEIVISQVIIDNDKGPKNVNVNGFEITWKNTEHFVYPIEPKLLPPPNDLQTSMYSMFEHQILCDLSIIAINGTLKTHSNLLFINGGDMIQKMLTSNMKESLQKTVHFDTFSLKTVTAFVNFIYLGEKGLEPKSVLEKGIDLCELFEMAHTYQITPLTDCCTNLFCLLSSVGDIDQIKRLVDTYGNEHLEKLHEFLLLKKNPHSYMKV